MGKRSRRRFIVVLMALVMIFTSILSVSAVTDSPGGGDAPKAVITSMSTTGNYGAKTIRVNYSGKNAVSYRVRYRIKGTSKWTIKTTTSKQYTITGLKDNGLYELQVAGVNSDGKIGAYHSPVYRYIQTAKLTSATAGSKSVTVKWNKVSGATGYQILYSTSKDLKGYKKINISSGSTTSYTIKNLTKGKTYYVKVRPVKKSGGKTYYGVLSNLKSATAK